MGSLQYVDLTYSETFMTKLASMQSDSLHTDVTLKIDNISIPCHKIILCTASPYFSTMFSSSFKESTSSEIEIKGTDPSTIQSIVRYTYTGKIEINTENAESLLQLSEQFQLLHLRTVCEKFIMQHVEADNCIGIYKFATLFDLKELADKARTCMLKNFCKLIFISSEFTQLSEDDLVDYISNDQLDIPDENVVFEAVIRWVQSYPEERRSSFARVAQHVRFPFCTGAYLSHVVSKEPLMSDPACQRRLLEAACYHITPGHERDNFTLTPRASFPHHRQLVVLGGLLKDDEPNALCWRMSGNTWEPLTEIPRRLWKFYSACMTPEGIVITGGYFEAVKTEAWLFSSVDREWVELPPMNIARCKHHSVYRDGSVFVAGGKNSHNHALNSVEKLNMRRRKWLRVASMKKHLSHLLAVSFGQSIFILAGCENGGVPSRCTQELDLLQEKWCIKADMPEVCEYGAAVSFGDKIFVVGGYSCSCMCYQPSANKWTVLERPCEQHGNAPAVVWKGRIIVGGGDRAGEPDDVISIIEEYDPKSNIWSSWNLPMEKELACHYMLNAAA